jgi:DNA-nicking Smr family endonuclease
VSRGEAELWRTVAGGVAPLRGKRKGRGVSAPEPEAETGPESPAPEAPAAEDGGTSKPRGPAPRRRPAEEAARPRPPGPLSHAAAPGLDKRTAERLRRGQIPVEAGIDLHGHTLEEARRALAGFLRRAWDANLRCVLVITGRGLRSGGPGEEGVMPRGVLRNQVPRWLNEPDNRARILAFCHAQPKDGGTGALYVLLKRKR